MTDTVLGGGDDWWSGSGFADNIAGGAGNDTLFGGSGSDTLFGQAGNDQLLDGSEGDRDQYFGGAGNDTVFAGFGDFGDIADGGADIDLLDVNFSFSTSGGLYMSGNSTGFALIGGARGIHWAGFEVFNIGGTQSDDTLIGAAGNDTLNGVDGNDTLTGRGGDDLLLPGQGNFLVDGGAGTDILSLRGGALAMHWEVATTWSFANAEFTGRADGIERLQVYGGDGGDIFVGGDLSDTLNGGRGDDTLTGGAGNDQLSGVLGSDLIYGGEGDDYIDDTAGFEAASHDAFFGGSGNDAIFGGAGNDSLIGGDGNDVLNSQGAGSVLRGGFGDDVLTAYDVGMTLDAGLGNDRVYVDVGGPGSTLLLNGGGGIDVLTRTLNFNVGRHDALETLMLANGTLRFSVAGVVIDQALGFEVFSLTGSGQGDTLRGGAGNDTLVGDQYDEPLTDHDRLSGGAGNDLLRGRSGLDSLYGGDGNDSLDGGLQKDAMTGGLGADRFIFTSAADTGAGLSRDVIADFVHLTDKIDLSAIDAAPGDTLVDAFTFLRHGLFSHHAGELRYIWQPTQTLILGDLDGDAKADFSIALTGKILLGPADFVL